MSTDIFFEYHGSLYLARPRTAAGREFISNTAPEDAQYFGTALVIEPRYVEHWVAAALESGLIVNSEAL